MDALSSLGRRTQAPPISWLMAMSLAHPELISLAAGFTDHESLPVARARELFNDLLHHGSKGRAALQYGTTAGYLQLRELTGQHLRILDGNADASLYSPERVVITSGSQQLLYMLSEALCDPGDIVLVEDPTYFVYLGIIQSHGLQPRTVPMQPDGLDLAHLEEVLDSLKKSGELRRVKLLYLGTYFQNPTGITTSLAKKSAAFALLRRYERAAGHPIYLVEDAAYRELRFSGDDVPSTLTASGSEDRVIYTGTYSKPFATGVRVGFGLLPEPILRTVLRIKGNHDFGSSNLLQHLLARALNTGLYDEHVKELRARYARKAEVMVRSMREHLPSSFQYQVPNGGLYFWGRLPGRTATGARSRFFKAALQRGVLYVPGELCYASDKARSRPRNELRLSFGAESVPKLREGIRRLGLATREVVGP